MSTSAYTHRHVLRATIEFTTPFLVGAGKGGDVADAVFVADANGLPAIPGSSLAGVLRSAFRTKHDETVTERVFGFQRGDQGQGSRLNVSWGCVHDSQNRPVEGIVPPSRLNDPVLAKARSPVLRDHVRINHRGASDAEEHGKFDEQAVCAGQRFTFELELVGAGTPQDQGDWAAVVALLAEPSLRLGGKTRRGFGAFKVVALHARSFDLRQDAADYARHPVALAEASAVLQPLTLAAPAWAAGQTVTATLRLAPTGYWLFGGGSDLDGVPGDADMAPVRDCRVVWKDNLGTVAEELLVIPATGIKGAIAHRVAFHCNALRGVFADQVADLDDVTRKINPAVKALFGCCKDSPRGGAGEREDGQRGRVILDDLYLGKEHASQLVHHVGIDRFTGGARDQVLFCERPLWQHNSAIELALHVTEAEKIAPDVRRALALALADLAEGRLQVGAGHGRGNGYFKGTVTWSDSGAWTMEKKNEVSA